MDEQYEAWLKSRKRFFRPLLIFLSIFYFALPISLALFPEFINTPTIIWGLPLIWLYAFLQIIMTIIVAHLYILKAKKLDQMVDEMRYKE